MNSETQNLSVAGHNSKQQSGTICLSGTVLIICRVFLFVGTRGVIRGHTGFVSRIVYQGSLMPYM